MTQITTSGGLITFQDTVTGLTKQIGQNRLWLMFKADTVNFLQVDVPTDGYDGTPFWACRASSLTINGETYTIEQLKNGEGLDGMFSSMSFNVEIVEELPDAGDPSTIYLIYDDETGTYTEYLWLAQEQVWEQLGSVADVDLGNYYNKSQVDQLLAAKANTSSLSTVATSGSYNDLSDKPVIPTVPTNVSAFTNDAGYLTEHQSLANYYNKSQTDNLLNGKVSTGTLATVATSGSYNDLTNKPDLSTKQDVLVSGVNIKTINSQSLLGEGNINIEGGGGGSSITIDSALSSTSENAVQNKVVKGALDAKADKTEIPDMAGYPTTNQMNTAINSAVAGKADANSVPTKTSQLANDSGFLTSHQSLDGLFDSVEYDSSAKRINFKDKTNTVVGYVDAAPFVKDGMVENVEIDGNNNLVITFNTEAGKQSISVSLDSIFNADNYYTKSQVDNDFAKKTDIPTLSDYYTKTEVNAELAKKADTDNLATVATSGSYNDLSDKPIIPEGAVIDSALSDSSNNAVANRIVKGALDLKADKTEIPDMAEYYTSNEVDGMIEGFVTQEDVDDLTADFAPYKYVDDTVNGAVDDAKPYVYESGNNSIETFDEAKTALVDNGRGLWLKSFNEDYLYYHPATWKYGETGAPKFIFTYVNDDGSMWQATAQKASESRKPVYNTVKWTYKTLTENDTYLMTFEDDNVTSFDDAVQAYNNGKTFVMVLRNGRFPLSVAYDDGTVEFSLSWIDVDGNITAYQVQKTGDGKENPYQIVWTDVTPEDTSITVDSALSSTSTNPVENRAIYAVIGDIESALQTINGTTNS